MRRLPAAVAAALVLVACSSTSEDETPAPVTSPTAASSPSAAATPTAAEDQESGEDAATAVPPLAEPPDGDVTLWLDTIGIPVVAAVRTSTQLSQLRDLPDDQRAATCRQVATDLDGIAPPQVLSALAITADAETATLLVGDLQAKGDLLARCLDGGPGLEASIAEVEQTHAVAVAWIERLRSGA